MSSNNSAEKSGMLPEEAVLKQVTNAGILTNNLLIVSGIAYVLCLLVIPQTIELIIPLIFLTIWIVLRISYKQKTPASYRFRMWCSAFPVVLIILLTQFALLNLGGYSTLDSDVITKFSYKEILPIKTFIILFPWVFFIDAMRRSSPASKFIKIASFILYLILGLICIINISDLRIIKQKIEFEAAIPLINSGITANATFIALACAGLLSFIIKSKTFQKHAMQIITIAHSTLWITAFLLPILYITFYPLKNLPESIQSSNEYYLNIFYLYAPFALFVQNFAGLIAKRNQLSDADKAGQSALGKPCRAPAR